MKASFMFCMSDLQWLKNNNADTRTFLQCLRESWYGAVVIVTLTSREVCPIKLNGDSLECVDKFCYLEDMIGSGGCAEDASSMRVKCAWGR